MREVRLLDAEDVREEPEEVRFPLVLEADDGRLAELPPELLFLFCVEAMRGNLLF